MSYAAVRRKLKYLIGILLLVGMLCIFSSVIGGENFITEFAEIYEQSPTDFWLQLGLIGVLLIVEVELLDRSGHKNRVNSNF